MFSIKQPKPSTSEHEFKMRYTFDQRKKESDRITAKYPNKCLIVVEKSDSSNVPDVQKKKWIVKEDLTFGQYVHLVKKNITLDNPKDILIFFVANSYLPRISDTIGEVYQQYKDKDGFLYVSYSQQEFLG